jgi:hypothetical protein
MVGTKKTRSQLLELYKGVMPLLIKLEIQCILFYGTLLGFQRESNFIEGDDDIDILVSRNDYMKLWRYLKVNNIAHKEYLNLLQLHHNDLGPFDVYSYDLELDRSLVLVKHNKLQYPYDLIFPVKDAVYHDFNVHVPSEIEKIIVLSYGEDWKTPVIKEKLDWKNIISKSCFITPVKR